MRSSIGKLLILNEKNAKQIVKDLNTPPERIKKHFESLKTKENMGQNQDRLDIKD